MKTGYSQLILLSIYLNRIELSAYNTIFELIHFLKGIINMASYKDRILFGVAYYNEYEPVSKLDKDIELMKKAHMNVIRVGEGSWSHWEPEDGQFNLDWLQPILDKAYANDIHVILGVPTFAIPQWLVRKYPEVALHDKNGNKHFFGSREEHSLSHPVFKYYSQRVIDKIVTRYKDHPAIIGWQLHNEPGLFINYSDDAFEGFKDYLRHKYQTVERLNKEWGLVYWSHELSTWDDLWKPEGNAQPQYDIEWRRYQASLTDDLLKWQSNLIKSKVPDNQFVTVNLALGRSALDEAKSSRHLDVASTDIYYHMQDGMKLPVPDEPHSWFLHGPWQIARDADRTYSVKQLPFCVAETDGGPIGGAGDNYPAYLGQWKQAAYQMIARGANMIEYWHWQQLHYGTETYWGGILPQDEQPGRVYREVAKLGASFDQYGKQIVDLKPDEDIAMLYSVKSRWGLEFEPYHAQGAEMDPHKTCNPQAYDNLFDHFYAGAYLANKQVHIIQDSQIYDDDHDQVLISPQNFAKQHPYFLVVGAYISSDEFINWLEEYIKAGGHLIIGPRTAFADDLARVRRAVKPAGLSSLASTNYQEYSNLRKEITVTGTSNFNVLPGAKAVEWIDMLQTDGQADVLANYDDPFFKDYPVLTSQKIGAGQLTIIGAIPNHQLAQSIFENLLPNTNWHFDNNHVTESSAINSSGDHLHFVFNWSWDSTTIKLPQACSILGEGQAVQSITLKPWDTVILREKD